MAEQANLNLESGNAAPPGNGADWTGSLEPDLKGLVQTKGWKGPADVLKSYAGLEKLVGADKVVLPPKGADGNPDWSKFDWGKIGRPESHDKYAFKSPEGYTQTETDKAFQAHMAPILHKAGLAQWQVDELAGGFSAFSAKLGTDRVQMSEMKATEADGILHQRFGLAYDQKMDQANRGIRFAGGQPLVQKLKTYGILGPNGEVLDADIAEMFSKIGGAFSEDGDMPQGEATATMTPKDAESQHASMIAEAATALKDGKSHPGHDNSHPEYRAWQDKKSRLAAMAWPEKKPEG